MNFIIKISGILFFLLLLGTDIALSQKKEEYEKKKKEIENEISYTNKLLTQTKRNTQLTLNQLAILNNQISKREGLIKVINYEVNDLDKKIEGKRLEIDRLSKELRDLKAQYAKMIYYAYKNKDTYDLLMFIFSSADFNQALLRLKYFQQYSQFRQKQAENIQKTKVVLNNKIQEFELKKMEKNKLLITQKNETVTLTGEKEKQKSAVIELQNKEKSLLATLREKEASSKKLQKAIEAIIAEEIRKTAERTKKGSNASAYSLTPEQVQLSKNFSNNIGKLPWPSERGVITGSFGVHPHSVLKGIQVKNNGIDISTTENSKARAVFGGEVTGIITIPGAGKAVIVRHGEYLSVYSNLQDVYVKKGDKVKTKQDIGLIYTDTKESKTELHFEIWKGTNLLNPADWLAR